MGIFYCLPMSHNEDPKRNMKINKTVTVTKVQKSGLPSGGGMDLFKNIIKHKVEEKVKLSANDKMFEKMKEEINELRGHKKQNIDTINKLTIEINALHNDSNNLKKELNNRSK